jgi:hypothetical protein
MSSLQTDSVLQLFENANEDEQMVWLKNFLSIVLFKDGEAVKKFRKLTQDILDESKSELRRKFVENFLLSNNVDPSVHNRKLIKVSHNGYHTELSFSRLKKDVNHKNDHENEDENERSDVLTITLRHPRVIWSCEYSDRSSYAEDFKLVNKVDILLECNFKDVFNSIAQEYGIE